MDHITIHAHRLAIRGVLDKVKKGAFLLEPIFEQDMYWPVAFQSELIKSIILRIPLSPFYMAHTSVNECKVLVGFNRLKLINDFINNGFTLKRPNNEDLNGKHFGKLIPKYQNRLEDHEVIVNILTSDCSITDLRYIYDSVTYYK